MSQVEHHKPGIEYWRSLQQLADTPEVRRLVEQEFPGYDASAIASTSRRKFLKIMAASMALAGLTLSGCRRWPKEKLAPYAVSSGNYVPGVPEQYATAMELGGVAQPLLVTSFDGRPIKIEGNPSHPFSRVVRDRYGAADAFAQASILEMYDPQRSRELIDRRTGQGRESTWKAFTEFAASHFASMKGSGQGFAILSESTNSPSVLDMRKRLLAAFPQAKWYEYEPLSRDNELEGARLAFGQAVRPRLHLDKAKVVVSLDEDLLFAHPAHVRYANDWSQWRKRGDEGEMNRVYIAETAFSVTGSVADVRLPIEPGRLFEIAAAMAARLGVAGAAEGKLDEEELKFVESAAADLKSAGKTGVVTAGPGAPPVVHALAHAINQKLGAVGTAVTLLEDPAGDRPTHMQAIVDLAKQMGAGSVKVLLILGGNPAYNAPIDAAFEANLAKVPVSIHLSLYHDETSRLCTWHLPRAHYLESWGDARAWDGSAGVCQPLIEPLFGGRTTAEVLAIVTSDTVNTSEQIVKRTWKEQLVTGLDFDKEFRRILEVGLLDKTAFKAVTPTLTAQDFARPAAMPAGMFLRFDADTRVHDGRFANNAWLQETADPLTKLVWDNAAIISKKDADRLGIGHGDVVRIDAGQRSMEVAAFILPGQPVGVIGLSLGYGRKAAGSVGEGLGFNAYSLRTSGAPWFAPGVKVTGTGQTYVLATTMEHHIIDPFATIKGVVPRVGPKHETGLIVREATLEQYAHDPHAPHAKSHGEIKLQIFQPPAKFDDPHAWGMAVDLNACIGCNACVVACQAENNVPVVGKSEVLNHREMQWIRIDRYFKGLADDPNPQIVFQPMLCVHCENAPCEQVCPVAATVHDSEGLNTMVYNRCIGTRYCSNNCPYKVRRFNYFDYHSKDPRAATASPYLGMPDNQQREQIDKIKQMVFNPEVTVRMRGVMEKCTYCTQRIHHAKVAARNAGADVKDGEILTACQQACPTQAIVFGNVKDPQAKVTHLHKNHRAYSVLGELNTRPRTRHLAKLRNPPSAAAGGGAAENHG